MNTAHMHMHIHMYVCMNTHIQIYMYIQYIKNMQSVTVLLIYMQTN